MISTSLQRLLADIRLEVPAAAPVLDEVLELDSAILTVLPPNRVFRYSARRSPPLTICLSQSRGQI
ncbi:hypothetical protein [Bradyrhizobium sp.]|jgi:hypothetical protein|uniref:hypothetical protein n=1 Tax=Bradyrhizobium sp. TaxID=376 RepID=UPI003BCF8E6C